ncbi:MAG: hypothetical protein IJ113_06095 [Eggerthellaceae bacterium]|nr:hypothetical protein [Eggerthellaceae bacterium]
MRRGTTPTFTFEVDLDLTGWDTYITFEQRKVEITRKDAAITPSNEGCIAEVELTQAETLAFKPGAAQAQLRAVKDGEAVASTIFDFEVGEILLDGEIPQEE